MPSRGFKTSWKTKICYAENVLKMSSRCLKDQEMFGRCWCIGGNTEKLGWLLLFYTYWNSHHFITKRLFPKSTQISVSSVQEGRWADELSKKKVSLLLFFPTHPRYLKEYNFFATVNRILKIPQCKTAFTKHNWKMETRFW